MNRYCKENCEVCLCDVCKSTREALEEAGKVTKKEVDEAFRDAEKMLEQIRVQEGR